MAIILVGTSWPKINLGSPDLALDKVAHFCAYTVLAALALRATLTPRELRTMLLVIGAVSLMGAVDEWHQSFIPGRSMSLLDWFADSAGAIVGTLAVRFLPFLSPRRPQLT